MSTVAAARIAHSQITSGALSPNAAAGSLPRNATHPFTGHSLEDLKSPEHVYHDNGMVTETIVLDNDSVVIYVLPSHRDNEDVLSIGDSDSHSLIASAHELNLHGIDDHIPREDDWEFL
ncbi:hypothetical protein BASA62_006154 [Batrachochytrium salamandrivorans]|nr:hypothetical protein BASA62_006154 [Batrachochytrium salamandrivorans]